MRISAWSSDVCSSDLPSAPRAGRQEFDQPAHDRQRLPPARADHRRVARDSLSRTHPQYFGRGRVQILMSQRSAAIDAFLDRDAAVAAVTSYASALDAPDWGAYRALFPAEIAIAYGPMGSLVAITPAPQLPNPDPQS